MPRKLPWMQKGGSTTTVTQPKKVGTPTTKRPKRPRSEDLYSDDCAGTSSKQKTGDQSHVNSSSPAQKPPSERFMDEGMDRDDKYRMVEDEFLTVAKKWTVHLHAAEYKRQEKKVKARNAETINSISRPVTDKMPDQTKRRVEGVARSKTQRGALEGLLGKIVADDTDDSDEDGLPYVGTTLHGLMDSPRRKATSLLKVSSSKTATRAAAGFQKPAQSRISTSQRMVSESSLPRHDHLTSRDESTASSDEDDDLDALIPAPELEPRLRVSKSPLSSTSRPIAFSSAEAPQRLNSTERSILFQSQVMVATVKRPTPSFTNEDMPAAISDGSRRRTKRQDLVRLEKVKQDKQEQQQKKKRDIIPTFL